MKWRSNQVRQWMPGAKRRKQKVLVETIDALLLTMEICMSQMRQTLKELEQGNRQKALLELIVAYLLSIEFSIGQMRYSLKKLA